MKVRKEKLIKNKSIKEIMSIKSRVEYYREYRARKIENGNIGNKSLARLDQL